MQHHNIHIITIFLVNPVIRITAGMSTSFLPFGNATSMGNNLVVAVVAKQKTRARAIEYRTSQLYSMFIGQFIRFVEKYSDVIRGFSIDWLLFSDVIQYFAYSNQQNATSRPKNTRHSAIFDVFDIVVSFYQFLFSFSTHKTSGSKAILQFSTPILLLPH